MHIHPFLKGIVSVFFFCWIMASMACNSANNRPAPSTADADTVKPFPLSDIIITDIKNVQKVPYFIYKITTTANGKHKDSSLVKVEEFEKLAAVFLEKDIWKPALKSSYKEAAFKDLTTKSYTITYTAKDPKLPIRDVLVLIDDQTSRVKNIFINSIFQSSDSTIIERLTWKPKKSFSINRSVQTKGKELETRVYVNWNERQQ